MNFTSETDDEDLCGLASSGVNFNYETIEVSPNGCFVRVLVTQFNEMLHSTVFKRVYRGLNNDLGSEIAWHVVELKSVPLSDRLTIAKEVKLNHALSHPHLIDFLDCWINEITNELVYITELATGGTLEQYLRRIKHPRLKVIRTWCKGLLKGLDYLHCQEPHPLVHCGLSCANIAVIANTGHVKITDSGLANVLQKKRPEFTSPETFEGLNSPSGDIYSLGMCLLEIVTQVTPYSECPTPAAVQNRILSRELPASLALVKDAEVREFILLCIGEARHQWSAKDLLSHSFLQVNDSDPRNHKPVVMAEFTRIEGVQVKSIELSVIVKAKGGDCKEVVFDYSLLKDTPETVSEEMVQELKLDAAVKPDITKIIEWKLKTRGNCRRNAVVSLLKAQERAYKSQLEGKN